MVGWNGTIIVNTGKKFEFIYKNKSSQFTSVSGGQLNDDNHCFHLSKLNLKKYACALRSFNSSEWNYSQIKKEGLAICTHFCKTGVPVHLFAYCGLFPFFSARA